MMMMMISMMKVNNPPMCAQYMVVLINGRDG